MYLDKRDFRLSVYAKNFNDALDIINNVEGNSADMARKLMFKETITKQFKTMGGYVLDYEPWTWRRYFDRDTAKYYLEDLHFDDEPIFSEDDIHEVISNVPDYSSKIRVKFRLYGKDAQEDIELANRRIGFHFTAEEDELGRNIYEAEFNGIEQFCKMLNHVIIDKIISVHYE